MQIKDDRLSLRKNYQSLCNFKDQLQSNDEYKLSLRKSKLFASLMKKRTQAYLNQSRQITFNDIISQSQLKTQVSMLQDYLYPFRSSIFTYEDKEYMSNVLIPLLSLHLFDQNSDVLSKESIVLIYIDIFDSFISCFVDIEFLTQLEQEIASTSFLFEKKYHCLLLILLSNILGYDEINHTIIVNTININTIIQSTFKQLTNKAKEANRDYNYNTTNDNNNTKDINNEDNDEMSILFLLITNFLYFYDNDTKNQHVIPLAQSIIAPVIINSYISMNIKLFFQGIKTLNLFSDCTDLISLVKANPDLLSILNEIMITKSNQSIVIVIICTLLSGAKEKLKVIMNPQLVQCLIDNVLSYCTIINDKECSYDNKKALYNKEGQVFIYSLRSLSHIISRDDNEYYSQVIVNKESNVIESLLTCFKTFHNDIMRREIINFFIKGLNCSVGIVSKAFINDYKIQEVFYVELIELCFGKYNENNCIISEILTLIENVLIVSSNTNDYLSIKLHLQQLDFVDNLTKIQLKTTSDAISTKIESLLSIHWNENEIYYNVCSEYMNVR